MTIAPAWGSNAGERRTRRITEDEALDLMNQIEAEADLCFDLWIEEVRAGSRGRDGPEPS